MLREYRQNTPYEEILKDSEGESASSSHGNGGHGNTRLPFGLCQRFGISLPDNATPHDAWEAIKRKTGLSPQDFYERLNAGEGSSTQDGTRIGGASDSAARNSSKIETCTTHEELSEYFSETYGVTVDQTVYELDFPSVHSAASGVDIVLREFPQAKGVLRRLSTGDIGFMCTSANGEIGFNPIYFRNGAATIQHRMELCEKSGFHPKNNGVRECGAHEMGHILELALIQRRFPYDIVDAWDECRIAGKVVSDAFDIIQKQTRQNFYDIKAEVSQYASDPSYTVAETFAECVADYVANGENAARLSREVWKILKKELG